MEENRLRNKQMIVRFTEKEFAEFISKMKRSGSKSRSDFIMALVRHKDIIVPNGLTELTTELKRQGNNLNQLARHFNQTGELGGIFEITIESCVKAYEEVRLFICKLNRRI